MKKILFISHEASRTGAPFVLLYLMKWMKANHPETRADVLLLNGGGLAEEFRAAAHTTFDRPVLFGKFKKSILYYFYRINRFYNMKNGPESFFEKSLLKKMAVEHYDIIYANTVLSIPAASAIKKLNNDKPQLVAHIHELDAMIEMALSSFDHYVPAIDNFIAVSKGVKNNLVAYRGIPSEKIAVVYEFSLTPKVNAAGNSLPVKDWLEVGGAGSVQFRKGFDIFIQAALFVKKKSPEAKIKFRWVGSIPDAYRVLIHADLFKAGVDNQVFFEDASDQPHEYFKNFDLFLLTSREDPFPLVCIEAGMLGKPVICFNQGNGTSEVIEEGGGKLIPYLNAEAMADAILHYYHHPVELKIDGEKAKALFSQFTPDQRCPQIYNLFKKG